MDEMEKKIMGTDTLDTLDLLDAYAAAEHEDNPMDSDFNTWFDFMTADNNDLDFEEVVDEPEDNWFPDEEEDGVAYSTSTPGTTTSVFAALHEALPVAVTKERNAAACRAWARENGHTVGTRGVIAEKIWEAWLAS